MVDYYRIKDFHLVSLRQIGQALLQPLISTHGSDTLYVAAEIVERPLVLPSEIATSAHNAGAAALSEELSSMATHNSDRRTSLEAPPPCFLLLLNAETFNDPLLGPEVVAVLDAGQQLVLVHDTSVAFSDVIQRTPQPLMDRGMYNELAVALHTGEHRQVSLRHIALKMATPVPSQPSARTVIRSCRTRFMQWLLHVRRRPMLSQDGAQMLTLASAPGSAPPPHDEQNVWKPVCESTRACASCGSHFLVNVKLNINMART